MMLEILELLVANPWLTGRATVAVLARKIDREKPTLLLDETDAAFKSGREYAEALRGHLEYRIPRRGQPFSLRGSRCKYQLPRPRDILPQGHRGDWAVAWHCCGPER